MEPAFYILTVEMKYPSTCKWPHVFTQFIGAWSTVAKCIEKANDEIHESYNNGQPIVWNDPVSFWDGKYQSRPVDVIETGKIKRTDIYTIQRCWEEQTDCLK